MGDVIKINTPFSKACEQLPNSRHHTCNVCGQSGPWTDDWSWRFIIYGAISDYSSYEEEYKMCSEKCREWAEENIKWRQKR